MAQIVDYLKKRGYPLVPWNSAAWHRANGSHGEDRRAPLETGGLPTRLPAVMSGTAHALHDAYNTVEIHGKYGVIAELKENLRLLGSFPRKVEQGEHIALVGLLRGGVRRSPHQSARWVDEHGVWHNGTLGQAAAYVKRREAADARKARAKAAAAAKAKRAARKAEVKRIAKYLNRHARALRRPKTAASVNGIPGPLFYSLEQAWGRANGMYSGKVTGVNSASTKKVDAYLVGRTA
jgi:hypothetical protein